MKLSPRGVGPGEWTSIYVHSLTHAVIVITRPAWVSAALLLFAESPLSGFDVAEVALAIDEWRDRTFGVVLSRYLRYCRANSFACDVTRCLRGDFAGVSENPIQTRIL
jgi:hypothetical protein